MFVRGLGGQGTLSPTQRPYDVWAAGCKMFGNPEVFLGSVRKVFGRRLPRGAKRELQVGRSL